MLYVTQAPEKENSGEREDGPAASAEAGSAAADFAFGEAEEAGDDERGEEQCPDDRFSDEDKTAGVPARVERKERTDAVVVGPVEQDVAEAEMKAAK